MSIFIVLHPFVCHYFLNNEKWGMKGLAMAQLVTNFASYFFMRALASCNKEMGKSVFFPKCKTCSNLWQFLSFAIPQFIMYAIDVWQW